MFCEKDKKGRTRNQNKKAETTKNESKTELKNDQGPNQDHQISILKKNKKKEYSKDACDEKIRNEKQVTCVEYELDNAMIEKTFNEDIQPNQDYQIYIKGVNSDITKAHQIKIRNEIWSVAGREVD